MILSRSIVFFSPKAYSDTQKVLKRRLRTALRPGLGWGSSRRLPRPTSQLGRGTPPPQSPPLDAFGVSMSALSTPHFSDFFSAYGRGAT